MYYCALLSLLIASLTGLAVVSSALPPLAPLRGFGLPGSVVPAG